jgi:hypothetical protein
MSGVSEDPAPPDPGDLELSRLSATLGGVGVGVFTQFGRFMTGAPSLAGLVGASLEDGVGRNTGLALSSSASLADAGLCKTKLNVRTTAGQTARNRKFLVSFVLSELLIQVNMGMNRKSGFFKH